jgi:hypothetical protein
MEQNQSFLSGIPGPQIDPNQIQTGIQNMLKQAAQAGGPALTMLGQLQDRRSARTADIAQALGTTLGTQHPDVVALQNYATTVENLKGQIDQQAGRQTRWPKPRPTEWVVFGTIVDATGQGAANLTVRVFDQERKFDELLGETTTDEFGDFYLAYSERKFKKVGEEAPDLFLMVTDPDGKEIYTSRETVRFAAGRSEYFAVRLEAKKRRTRKTKG